MINFVFSTTYFTFSGSCCSVLVSLLMKVRTYIRLHCIFCDLNERVRPFHHLYNVSVYFILSTFFLFILVISLPFFFLPYIFYFIFFQMVIGHTYKIAVGIIALICSMSCFSNDKNNADITEFSKALGVFFYLMIRRSKPTAFLSQILSQVN